MAHYKLIVNPIGGMANRMRAIASGISLASAIRQREPELLRLPDDLSVIWLKNRELNAEYTDIFRMPTLLRESIVYPGKARYELLYSIPRKRNMYVTTLTARRHGLALYDQQASYHTRFGDDTEGRLMLSAVSDTLRRGRTCFLQCGTIFYPFGEEMYRQLFRPADEIADLAHERLSRLGGRKVGIHIRRSDNLESVRHSPDRLFIDKMTEILNREPDTRFYLATDDEQIKQRFATLFGPRVVSSDSKADRNSVVGIKEAAVELFTLAGTDMIFGSYYSSFSEAAAMLGGKPFRQLMI